MDIGVNIFPTDRAIQPIPLARECEARGFESLWFPEHSHIPTSRETPWGGRADLGPLPEEYRRTHDQFIALAACAAVTTRLRLGTGITLVAQRDPIWLAKEVASLDVISGGRFELGIGYGWNVEEMRNHGVDFKQRREILREHVLLMKALWTQDEAEFSGKYVKFEKSWAWPKPVQKPHPPIVMGGAAGPKTAENIAEFCDAWMPLGGLHEFDGGLAQIKAACRARGRDPASIKLGVTFPAPPPADGLKGLAEKGVTRVILPLPPVGPDVVLPILDKYTKLM
jgi:probable F420-dependent oxidoreductase